MNKSLSVSKTKRSYIIIIAATAMLAVILFFIIKGSFLENFLIERKINTMIDTYREIDEAANKGEIRTEEFERLFRAKVEQNSFDIIVRDSSSNTVVSSSRDFERQSMDLMGYIFGRSVNIEDEILKSTERYSIVRVKEPTQQLEYLDMWGILENGDPILIRCSMEGIRNSVELSSGFFTYIIVGLIGFLLSVLLLMNKLKSIEELKIENERLQKDIERENELSRMRSEFISNVSQELKTPIALIKGYAEGLCEGVNDDEESRAYYCDVIADEADRMGNMVKKLIDINHLKFDDIEFDYECFDVNELISSFLNQAVILAKEKDVTVNFCPKEPVTVMADTYYTEEILSNYYTNAINYVSGKNVIDIEVGKSSDKAYIYVKNTGEHIPEESLTHLFEMFYKVDKARTRSYGGSGVGLSIVKLIQDRMGEEYGVKNTDDGVMFYYTVPLAKP